jgi:Fe-S cluster biogenesis protein NfuA
MTERTKEEIMKNIDSIIDQYVQPAVASHGGMIRLEDFDMESGRVLVMLQGSCSGCASSTITLKMGVENMLKHYIQEVKSVVGVDDPAFNNPYYTNAEFYDDWREEDFFEQGETQVLNDPVKN